MYIYIYIHIYIYIYIYIYYIFYISYIIYIYTIYYIYILYIHVRFYRRVIWLWASRKNRVGMKPCVDGVVERPASAPSGPHVEVHPTAVP